MNRQQSLRYLPGLDGLRAVAVIAVILYHANKNWLSGGFLGVEVFFVISGYLITMLLINESQENGKINFRAFWIRRARRLSPRIAHCSSATRLETCAEMWWLHLCTASTGFRSGSAPHISAHLVSCHFDTCGRWRLKNSFIWCGRY